MAHDVLIAGALFSNVPSISVPDQSNNWHSYVDTSDANATADDILNGETAYVNGVKLTGTYVPTPTQSKTATPSTSQQTISPDPGYLLSSVTVNAMPSGTAGIPSAVKSSVANHSVTVTPSVTNTTGYITGGALTGTPALVRASELVSGTLSITDNGTGIDVTNYASVDVNVSGGGGGGTKTVDISITPRNLVWIDGDGTAHTETPQSAPSKVCLSGSLIVFTYLVLQPGEELTVSNAQSVIEIDHGSRSNPRHTCVYQVD